MKLRIFWGLGFVHGFSSGDDIKKFMSVSQDVELLTDSILNNIKHFRNVGVLIVGNKLTTKDRVVDAGLSDISSVENQFSDSAEVTSDVQKGLDTIFDIEPYAGLIEKLPAELQLSFYDELLAIYNTALEVLDSMQDRADKYATNQLTIEKPEEVRETTSNQLDQDTDEDQEESGDQDTDEDQDTDDDQEDSGDRD